MDVAERIPWPLGRQNEYPTLPTCKGVRHIRDVPLYRCVLLLKRFGFLERGMVSRRQVCEWDIQNVPDFPCRS